MIEGIMWIASFAIIYYFFISRRGIAPVYRFVGYCLIGMMGFIAYLIQDSVIMLTAFFICFIIFMIGTVEFAYTLWGKG